MSSQAERQADGRQQASKQGQFDFTSPDRSILQCIFIFSAKIGQIGL
jgi:hypothetical protein